MLPRIPKRDGPGRLVLSAFGGLERRAGAGNGAICGMRNLTGADAPLLASRPKRRTAAALTKPRGLFAVGDALYRVEAGRLRTGADGPGLPLPAGEEPERRFAAMGERLLIWPDRCLYDPAAGTLTPLWAETVQSCTFADGTYAGAEAEGNTILAAAPDFDWAAVFRPGDAVTVSGAADPENNKTAIVREIAGNALRFYEHSFTVNAAAAELTVARGVPDLDFLCVNDNRVWGCRGDTVCCCKLGDPTNWNVFDGLSTDAWSVETGTPGVFTGCVSFMGYPIFFKADRIFKVYGSRPANFELMAGAALGILPGADGTAAAAGETLFYLSRAGFVRYNGGFPTAVDAPLNARYAGGAAGSDGKRYYVSALRADGAREMLVYDPGAGTWHREDELAARALACRGGTLFAATDTALLALTDGEAGAGEAGAGEAGTAETGTEEAGAAGAGAAEAESAEAESAEAWTEEADFESCAVFAPFDRTDRETFAGKYPVRLWLRLENAGPVTADIRCDGGDWETAATVPAGPLRAGNFPVPIRRCDRFALRLTATGPWRLRAMELELRSEGTARR